MSTHIRPAAEADIPAITELARRMHAESPRYAHLPFDSARLGATARQILATGLVLLAELDAYPVGLMAGAVAPHFFSQALYGVELAVYVAPEHRGSRVALRMISRFEAWAKARGAGEMCLGISTGLDVPRTQALYERLGYRPSGVSLIKEL